MNRMNDQLGRDDSFRVVRTATVLLVFDGESCGLEQTEMVQAAN